MDWKKIKAEYIRDGTSYRKLAEKHGVSFNTLKTRAIDEQWYKLRQQTDHKTTTKILEDIIDKEAQRVATVVSVADKVLKRIERLVEDETMFLDTQSLKQITSSLKDLRDIKGEKSEQDRREQEARIKNLEKQAEGDANVDRNVIVTFGGNLDEYSRQEVMPNADIDDGCTKRTSETLSDG